MPEQNRSFQIVIPVHNEEQTLEKNITDIYITVSKLFRDTKFSLTIADNASNDNTASIGNKLCKQYQYISYLRVEKKGVGAALKKAWSKSNADVVGYMDLDMATDLSHLVQVKQIFDDNKCDILYGSRLHTESVVIGRSLKREIVSRIFNQILSRYLNVKISDGMCGFKFLNRSKLKDLLMAGAKNDGWFFCSELLTVACWQNMSVYELPVRWTDDPNSKVRIMKLTIEYMRSMHQLKQKRI